MNLCTKQKQTHKCRKQPLVTKGEREEGHIRSLGLTDTAVYKIDKQQESTI